MNFKSIWNAMCGRNALDEVASFEKTAASLQQFLMDKDTYTILCVGTLETKKLEESVTKLVEYLVKRDVAAGIGEGYKYSFLVGGNVLKDAKSIELVSKANGVVLMEEAFASTFANIDEEINALKELHAEVVGVILIHH